MDSVVLAVAYIHQMKKTNISYKSPDLPSRATESKVCHIYIEVMNCFRLTCHAYLSFRYWLPPKTTFITLPWPFVVKSGKWRESCHGHWLSGMKKVHLFFAGLLYAQIIVDILTERKSSEWRQQGGSMYNCPWFVTKESLSWQQYHIQMQHLFLLQNVKSVGWNAQRSV